MEKYSRLDLVEKKWSDKGQKFLKISESKWVIGKD